MPSSFRVKLTLMMTQDLGTDEEEQVDVKDIKGLRWGECYILACLLLPPTCWRMAIIPGYLTMVIESGL